ncbi:hypothetical protein ASA1KI_06930 [Opitutales bacterium ASA1]|uniref:hypothetical protein n=1 Tax=Congregicoccus parvus TaxID=3081749 RepID=UPI002B2DC0F8|nr:hypothetical protein ASA1KI_06930 [Opitutales bacterium ASA1]
MSEPATPPVRTPWHLWVVGVLSLLWNAVGVFDFVMTQTRNESYMSNFTPEQLEYFYGFPAWVVTAWAVATCGSLLGSVLLLLRSRFAVPVNLAVLAAMALTFVHNLLLSDGLEIMGGAGPLVFTIVILAVGVLLWVYARAMASRGVLR